MVTFDWQDFLAMGERVIDDDHMALFAILNTLAPAESHLDRDAVRDAVAAFGDRLAEHCVREEALMEALGFPLLDLHRRHHAEALAQMDRWRRRVTDAWRPSCGANFFLTAGDALVRHIVKEDHAIKRFRRAGHLFMLRAA